MLRSNLSTEEFDAVVPPISTLISEFGLDPSVAFAICRPSIQAWMHKEDRKPSVKDATTTSPPPTTNGDVPMLDVATEATAAITDGKAGAEVNTDNTTEVEMADVSTISNESDNSPKRAATPTPWHPVLETLMDELKPVLRDGFEEHMSISFYVRFWQLSLHDMFIPSYETETKRLQVKLAAVNADRSDVSREGVKRKETEKKRLTDLQDGLRNEMKSHIASYQAVRKKLGKEKDHWFVHIPPAKHSLLSDAIIQECLFPRIILSPSDAQFAARFIFFAHQQGTPAFRTLHIFDRMLREQQILATLFQCTAREAENFGRFLHDILKELRQWRIDKATFEKVGLGGPKKQLPGLATKLNPDLTPKDIINYEQFRRILFRWHIQLGDAMKACLKSGEYMHIRNGCIVLKAVHKQWPEVNFQGDQVQKAITELSINDERQDLKLSALSLLGDLKKRSTAWVLPQTFRLVSGFSQLKMYPIPDNNQGDVPQSKEPSRSTSARPEKSQPALKPSKPLDPKVPEFKSNTAS
jgi:THO complex subunit 2